MSDRTIEVALEKQKVMALDARHQQAVYDEFRKFAEGEIPSIINSHKIGTKEVVIRIFDFIPPDSKSTIFVDIKGTKSNELQWRTFSFAKVLLAGSESGFSQGDIVKLRDMEVATVVNPNYILYDAASGPLHSTKTGEAPQKYINTLFANKALQDKRFHIDPLALDYDPKQNVTFKVHVSFLDCTEPYNYEDFIK